MVVLRLMLKDLLLTKLTNQKKLLTFGWGDGKIFKELGGENETDSKIPCETSGVTMESSPKVVPQFYNLLVIDGIV